MGDIQFISLGKLNYRFTAGGPGAEVVGIDWPEPLPDLTHAAMRATLFECQTHPYGPNSTVGTSRSQRSPAPP